jgi:thiol-disulfide isomerase/thioredoxin
MQIDTPATEFSLPDLNGTIHRLGDYRGKVVVIDFWSCECPHSERTDRLLIEKMDQWPPEVVVLFIASNRSESTQSIGQIARERRLPIVLLDAHQAVADLYEAQTTPHVFVIDPLGMLRYRGALDDVTFRRRNSTRFYLDEAVKALLTGQLPDPTETPAFGCTIVREV